MHRTLGAWSLAAVVAVSIAAPLLATPGRAAALAAQYGATSTWTTQVLAAGPTSFTDLSCPSKTVCTAVGGGGSGEAAIFRTTNGGSSWFPESPPLLTPSLNEVSCPTASFCLAVGQDPYEPVVIETTDAGGSWTTVSASFQDADFNVNHLDCVTRATCYATLSDGSLTVSRNGGASWTDHSLGTTSYPDALSCPSPSTCFLSGSSAGTLTVQRSAGFGTSIKIVASLRGVAVPYHVSSIACPTPTYCMVVTTNAHGAVAYTSSNGGTTWSHRSLPLGTDDAFGVGCSGTTFCAVDVSSSRHVQFLMASSTNQGRSWRLTSLPGTAGSTLLLPLGGDVGSGGISCPVTGRCFLAGFATPIGSIYAELASTPAWSRRVVPSGPAPLSAIACPTDGTCVAVGDGVAMWSGDGGTSWQTAATPPPSGEALDAIACPTAELCLAVGGKDLDASASMYRSLDGGQDWTAVTLPSGLEPLASIACATPTTCVATSSYGAPHVVRTIDGGQTWAAASLPLIPSGEQTDLSSVTCPSATYCVTVGSFGSANVLVSSDAGLSWSLGASGVGFGLFSVTCASATTCLAAGATTVTPARGEPGAGIFRTVDGGLDWTQLATPGFNATSIACDDEVCQELATTPPWFGPPTTTLETSTDAGVDWTTTALPSLVAFGGICATPSGRWVLAGGDASNGALVITDP